MVKSAAVDYQKLFKFTPSLDLVLSVDLVVIEVSDAYLEATLNTRENMIGRTMFEALPENPNDLTATGVRNLKESLQRVLKNKEGDAMAVQRYDIRRPASQGGGFEERYWSPYNSPILDEKGDIQYILHRAVDVTEFVKLKQQGGEKLKADKQLNNNINEKIEAEIYKRAQEVAEANRKLQALDEMKTNFFANVSHELRTPLTLILGPITSILTSSELPKEMRHSLEVVERNAQLLLKQVNDLLDVAKLEANKHTIEYARIDVVKLLKSLTSSFEFLAKNRGIEFLVETPLSVVMYVDLTKLQRILLNLLSNAFKFTPHGGKVKITLSQDEENATFCVMDSGIGIPEEEREAIFERFHQVDGGARRMVGGTGLGLTIVKEFIALHQGSIQVDESPQGGAMFKVVLPIKAEENIPVLVNNEDMQLNIDTNAATITELKQQFSTGVISPISSSHLGALVLIVDDNSDMRNYIAELMANYRVETATNGKEGLDKARELMPDLIISDVMMPQMSGDEMAHELLLAPQTKDIPLLMVTAKTDDKLKLDLIKDGVCDYINKPFAPEEMRLKAENLIVKHRRTIADREAFIVKLTKLVSQLTQSNKDLEYFAYAAAHDMQTPLHSIGNLAKWIEEDSGDSLKGESLEHIQKLRHQVCCMEKLLNDMLEYARIEQKQHLTENMLISGSELMNTIIALISPPKSFNIHFSQAFIELHMYRMPLQKILYNLITNAIKHHDKDAGLVQVDVENNDTYFVITVCDDGPGIEPKYHQKIFEIFQTLRPKSQTAGSGMGLAIVKKLVTMHGGNIEVESKSKRGTCFRFTWPKSLEEEEEGNAQQQYA